MEEHPSKRRKIERRAAGHLRRLHSRYGNNEAIEKHWKAYDGPAPRPKVVISSAILGETDRQLGYQLGALHKPKPKPGRLQLRDIISTAATNTVDNIWKEAGRAVDNATHSAVPAGAPVTQAAVHTANSAVRPVQQAAQPAVAPVAGAADKTVNQAHQAANKVAQAVKQAAQPIVAPVTGTVDKAAEQAQQHVNHVAQPGHSQAVQLVVNGANNAAAPVDQVVHQTIPAPVDPVSQPVDDIPGLVSPPPAAAAEAARKQALADQEAETAQENPSSPSTEALAPPARSGVADANEQVAVSNAASQSAVSLRIPSTSTQVPLSEPSTPLPQSPILSPSSSYFPPPQLPNLPSPTPSPGAAYNPSPPPNNNSTMSTSATSTTSSSSSVSLSSFVSASEVTVSSLSSMGSSVMPSSSNMGSTTASTKSSFGLASSSTHSSLITSTSASQPSSQVSSSTSVSAPSSSTAGEGLVSGSPTFGGPASATTTAGSGSGGDNGLPPTKVLVGGICGGIAGLVLILAALLFLLRWRKGMSGRRDISPPVPQSAGAGSAALGSGGAMTQRSSVRSSAPIAAAASLIGRLRPASSQTATTTSTSPSEKGFQKISGRKLPSVLHSGGDGYSGAPAVPSASSSRPPARQIASGQGSFAGLAPALRPPSPQRSLSGSSFYRDSQGFYGGVVPLESTSEDRTDPSSSPTSSSPSFPLPPSSGVPFAGAGHPPGRSSPGVPNIRPGPARQPVIQQGGVVPMRTPSRPGASRQRTAPSPIAENPRDALGRSHPSQDGSRQSRFRESTTPP